MLTLKDQISNDIDTFMSLDEFAETHEFNEKFIKCIFESINSSKKQGRELIYNQDVIVFCKESELDYIPKLTEEVYFDKKLFLCGPVSKEDGILKIILNAVES